MLAAARRRRPAHGRPLRAGRHRRRPQRPGRRPGARARHGLDPRHRAGRPRRDPAAAADRRRPTGVQVWTVRAVNPDGLARGTRQNVHGVDLNRNFPRRWRGGGRPFDRLLPRGERGLRARDARADAARAPDPPDISIHYHQHCGLVNLTAGPTPRVSATTPAAPGCPRGALPGFRGTATGWQNTRSPGERLRGRAARRGAERRGRAPPRPRGARRGGGQPARSAAGHAAARSGGRGSRSARPAAPDARLRASATTGSTARGCCEPKVIVEHFTATSTYCSAWNTFAANSPDVEFGERPGVCAHFIVDRDGTIHQLVPLKWMCRHTVGLNHVAIGIEHVGDVRRRRDGPAPPAAGLAARSPAGSQSRYGDPHARRDRARESLSSPYHRERVAAMRNRDPRRLLAQDDAPLPAARL